MDCNSLQDPSLLLKVLKKLDGDSKKKKDGEDYFSRDVQEQTLNSLKACMYHNYFEGYSNKAKKQYLAKFRWNAFIKSIEDDLISDSFEKGVKKVFEGILKGEQVLTKEGLQNYFFSKCYWQLRGEITNEIRRNKKHTDLGLESSLEMEPPTMSEEEWDRQYKLYIKGMESMEERCRKLISSRILNKFGKVDLAAELDISEGFINEAVYRCKNQLIKIIRKLQSK